MHEQHGVGRYVELVNRTVEADGAQLFLNVQVPPVKAVVVGAVGFWMWEALLVRDTIGTDNAYVQAPVVMSANGRGAISDRHYLGQNSLAGMELIQDADVIFVLTTNRADLLEPALAARPGRVDQAVVLDHRDLRNSAFAHLLNAHLTSFSDAFSSDVHHHAF